MDDPPPYSPPPYPPPALCAGTSTNNSVASDSTAASISASNNTQSKNAAPVNGARRNPGRDPCRLCLFWTISVVIVGGFLTGLVFGFKKAADNATSDSGTYSPGPTTVYGVGSTSANGGVPDDDDDEVSRGAAEFVGGGSIVNASDISSAAPSGVHTMNHTSLSSFSTTTGFSSSSAIPSMSATGLSYNTGSPHHDLSGGQIAGIVVGVVVFVILVLSGALCLVFRKSLRARMQRMGLFCDRKQKGKNEGSGYSTSSNTQPIGDNNGSSINRSSVSNASVADTISRYSAESGSIATARPVAAQKTNSITHDTDPRNSVSDTAPAISLSMLLPLEPIDLEQGDLGTDIWRN